MNAAGLRARAAVLRAIRGWFDDHGFLEVPTPVLVPSPAMEPQLFAVPAGDGFLRTSPEFALKKVLAAGLPRIYEIGPCFRDRERGQWHGREFLMLEWYRAGGGLSELIDDVRQLVAVSAAALGVPSPVSWEEIPVRRLLQRSINADIAKLSAVELSPRDGDDWDTAFFRRWVEDVEPTLTHPVFVTEWPASQAALAQIRDDGEWPTACRFEGYLGGVELCNAFLELVDATEQRRRFLASRELRVAMGEDPHPLDESFIAAVGHLPPTAGIALGVDRLVAALCGWDGIENGRVA